jgi:non-homologous end joining protein Ku
MAAAPPAPAKVVNLMDALRQSIEQVNKPLAKADAPRAASAAAKRHSAIQRPRRAGSRSA